MKNIFNSIHNLSGVKTLATNSEIANQIFGSNSFWQTIISVFCIWLANRIYVKRCKTRPRLFVTLEKPLFSVMNDDYTSKFVWSILARIKNKSNYTAYDLNLCFATGHNLSDHAYLKSKLPPNNHLEPLGEIEMELKTQLTLEVAEYLNIRMNEDGSWLIIPGTQIENPAESLKPRKVDNVRLILKYTSEENVTFYTKFHKKDGKESISFWPFRPYLLFDFLRKIENSFKKAIGWRKTPKTKGGD